MSQRFRRFQTGDHADPGFREAWCEWFRKHGIDPNVVAVPGWVWADDDASRITWDAYHHTDGKNPIHFAWKCPDNPRGTPTDIHVCRVERMVQLEAPALPMPRIEPHERGVSGPTP